MLQTRNAKRPAQAAVRFAVDAVERGAARPAGAMRTIDAGALDALLHPTFDRDAEFDVLARAWPRRPARRRARSCSRPTTPWRRPGRQRVILVRPFTEADDVAGFYAAQGILTSEGGKARHAALVARGMGKPCVSGAGDARHRPRGEDDARRTGHAQGGRPDRDRRQRRRGDARRRAARGPEGGRALRDGARAGPTSCARSACARTPTRPRTPPRRASSAPRDRPLPDRAHVHGRRPPAEDARDDHGRGRGDRRAALDELLPLQQGDFEGLFDEMAAFRSRSGCWTRRCTSSYPTWKTWRARPSARGSSGSDDARGARAHARAGARAGGDEPHARYARRAPRRSSIPRSTRCRCGRSSARRALCATAPARRPALET